MFFFEREKEAKVQCQVSNPNKSASYPTQLADSLIVVMFPRNIGLNFVYFICF